MDRFVALGKLRTLLEEAGLSEATADAIANTVDDLAMAAASEAVRPAEDY